jgi:MFS family permease
VVRFIFGQRSKPMNPPIQMRPGFFSAARDFIKRQERDWKVTVVRTSLDKIAYQMIFPYLSIYIVALGASGTQLGLVNSVGMVFAAAISLLVGWLIDRTGPKRIYLFGIGMLAVSYLTYATAGGWRITVLAMICYWLGDTVSKQSCATVCGNCLVNQDRATGMMICETVAAGLLGMAGPMIAAWLVTAFGGVSTKGIRPLFFVGMAISICSLYLVYTRLSDRKWSSRFGAGQTFFYGFYSILRDGRYLYRWLLIMSVGSLPLGMVFPFSQVFAKVVKGADGLVLGAMVTGASLTSIVLAIPMGRLADRIGRKRILYLNMPLFWLSNVILVWATGPIWLIVAGVLQGFFWLGGPVASAMERELVPADRMGRWLGLSRFCRMLFSAAMAFLAGLIWDKVGPQYVFLLFVGLELVIRLPLLISMPETLNFRFQTQGSSPSATK